MYFGGNAIHRIEKDIVCFSIVLNFQKHHFQAVIHFIFLVKLSQVNHYKAHHFYCAQRGIENL